MTAHVEQEDWIPVTCPTCDELMWFRDFYLQHVYKRHGLRDDRCPFCLGEQAYTVKHAKECSRHFLDAYRFVDQDLERIWMKKHLNGKTKYLKSEIAYLESRKEVLDLDAVNEQLKEQNNVLKRCLLDLKFQIVKMEENIP